MSKANLEQIIEEAKSLTLEEQRQLREALDKEARTAEQEERDRLASSIRGKYANVLSSSEEFAARKAEEIALEDRR
jgi:regulator of replication initiation timing